MNISYIEEEDYILNYLIERNLLNQYKKVKKFLLIWNSRQVDFKLKKPKSAQIYYFRINQQFRALCHFEWNVLVVFKIDNHQNK
ncbi:MAG: hypothetical protein ACD_49C00072G0005 [uncultured bacterium (gcode 4)]|uniref:Uncharacterized protein n=1 Tax=uncultured bacterium (gcode 4) TaxID=1234023 RepID=K2BB28_9BACT|nr:MAG: hypothetical protein ACD_49C00072G0005 [uncultured bacterium (gcode 4)]